MQKPIPGFSDYEITDDGRVWSKPMLAGPREDRRNGRWMSTYLVNGGYARVTIVDHNGHRHGRLINRLVLEAFVGPCPTGMECCHNNGIKADNRLENLRWDTKSANCIDRVKHGTCHFADARGERHYRACLTELDVRWIRYLTKAGVSHTELSEVYPVSRAGIADVVNRRSWTHIPAAILP